MCKSENAADLDIIKTASPPSALQCAYMVTKEVRSEPFVSVSDVCQRACLDCSHIHKGISDYKYCFRKKKNVCLDDTFPN